MSSPLIHFLSIITYFIVFCRSIVYNSLKHIGKVGYIVIPSIPQPLVRTNQSVIFISSVLAIFTQQAWILMLPLAANLLGLMGFNPIMRVAKLFLRKPMSQYIPEDVEQQRFNSYIAIFCLALATLGFSVGIPALGYVFASLVAVASGVALSGFCVGCFLYFQLKRWQHKRSLAK